MMVLDSPILILSYPRPNNAILGWLGYIPFPDGEEARVLVDI